MLLAAGVVSCSLSASSAGVSVPLGCKSARRAKSTSVGIAGREEVSAKILDAGLQKVARKKRKAAVKSTLRGICADDGSGRGGAVWIDEARTLR